MSFALKSEQVVNELSRIRIVPVLVLNDVESGLKMCEILVECGLPAAEITFRTQAAEAIIKEAAKRFPDLYLGAGTILNVHDLKRAFDAGAKFAVAPGFNPTVVRAAVESDFAFAPGVCTPSEVEQAHELGCKFLKFFPAEAAGGVKMLKSLIAPYKPPAASRRITCSTIWPSKRWLQSAAPGSARATRLPQATGMASAPR